MPLMSGSLTSVLWASRPCRITASSSAVRTGSVAMRQCSTTSSPENTPSTVLVFPTSIVSSMMSPPPDQGSPPSVTRVLSISLVVPDRAATSSSAGPRWPSPTSVNVTGSTSSR